MRKNRIRAIVFYAEPKVSGDLWPVLFQVLAALIWPTAPASYQTGLSWTSRQPSVRGSDDLRGILFSKVISVKLLGRCDVLPQTDHPSSRARFGWVMLVSGTIQPFISIDCTRIAEVLRPTAAGLKQAGPPVS